MSSGSYIIGIALVKPRRHAEAARKAHRSKWTMVRMAGQGMDKMFSIRSDGRDNKSPE